MGSLLLFPLPSLVRISATASAACPRIRAVYNPRYGQASKSGRHLSLISSTRYRAFSMSTDALVAPANSEREAKRARTEELSPKVIGTHNGTFHCDEALACFLLRLTSEYRESNIVRSRDPKVLNDCDIVVDVGGVYDDSKRRYDHHQRGFEETLGFGFNTKLSSAGLVFKHFGREIVASQLQVSLTDPTVEVLWFKMYKEFIEAIDAIDNGIAQYENAGAPRYSSRTDLSSRVGWLNPAWNESVEPKLVDSLFIKASELTGSEFLQRLQYYSKSWLPARDIVKDAFAARKNVHPSGSIIVFDRFAPWKEHLFDLEREMDVSESERPLYILYPDEAGSNWRIQAVPVSPESFESRRALPAAWRGLRDDVLSNKCGIPGCIFVHSSGFIGGNSTRDGVLDMAKLSLADFNET